MFLLQKKVDGVVRYGAEYSDDNIVLENILVKKDKMPYKAKSSG